MHNARMKRRVTFKAVRKGPDLYLDQEIIENTTRERDEDSLLRYLKSAICYTEDTVSFQKIWMIAIRRGTMRHGYYFVRQKLVPPASAASK